MNIRPLLLALLLSSASLTSAEAQLLNFDFTFSGIAGMSNIGGGIVSGKIIGLENNATSIPSDIIITSAPAGLDITSPLPYSLAAHGWNLAGDSEGASITVSEGMITSGTDYEANLLAQGDFFSLDVPSPNGPLNGFEYDSKYVANTGGFGGVIYSPASTPEPSSWLLSLLCLVSFAILRHRAVRP